MKSKNKGIALSSHTPKYNKHNLILQLNAGITCTYLVSRSQPCQKLSRSSTSTRFLLLCPRKGGTVVRRRGTTCRDWAPRGRCNVWRTGCCRRNSEEWAWVCLHGNCLWQHWGRLKCGRGMQLVLDLIYHSLQRCYCLGHHLLSDVLSEHLAFQFADNLPTRLGPDLALLDCSLYRRGLGPPSIDKMRMLRRFIMHLQGIIETENWFPRDLFIFGQGIKSLRQVEYGRLTFNIPCTADTIRNARGQLAPFHGRINHQGVNLNGKNMQSRNQARAKMAVMSISLVDFFHFGLFGLHVLLCFIPHAWYRCRRGISIWQVGVGRLYHGLPWLLDAFGMQPTTGGSQLLPAQWTNICKKTSFRIKLLHKTYCNCIISIQFKSIFSGILEAVYSPSLSLSIFPRYGIEHVKFPNVQFPSGCFMLFQPKFMEHPRAAWPKASPHFQTKIQCGVVHWCSAHQD